MPLIADYKEIKDYENVVRIDGKENPVTVAIVFSMMPIGMSCITEKNLKEVATRMVMYKYLGPNLTMDDLRKHIGLKVNVSDMTPTQFKKQFADNRYKESAYAVSSM